MGGVSSRRRVEWAHRCLRHLPWSYYGLTSARIAEVAELVDALDLGSSGVTRPGSSPGFRILLSCIALAVLCTMSRSRLSFAEVVVAVVVLRSKRQVRTSAWRSSI